MLFVNQKCLEANRRGYGAEGEVPLQIQGLAKCSICDRSLGLEEHVTAAEFDCLCAKLSDTQSIQAVAGQFWQAWQVPGRAIRFNHVHGRQHYMVEDVEDVEDVDSLVAQETLHRRHPHIA